ncbi:hypothetical protein [Paenibacillus elgii]|uniref:hypothetical protein n=1 Tax=Paenibacillus elgii TaxID=189691 RepID=UPI000FDB24DD|nr:hypothetical protein [Paenibacillus elgii]NEN82145.1 hypothetical protein [Paenibacillus elgii]
MSQHKQWRHHQKGNENNKVNVWQSSKARTGQGGNAFAINASDVGVVKTKVTNNNSKKKK